MADLQRQMLSEPQTGVRGSTDQNGVLVVLSGPYRLLLVADGRSGGITVLAVFQGPSEGLDLLWRVVGQRVPLRFLALVGPSGWVRWEREGRVLASVVEDRTCPLEDRSLRLAWTPGSASR